MAWTGQSFSVGQILTAAQMNNLQADITAAFNKDGGAPVLANNYVVLAMMAANSVDSDQYVNDSIDQAHVNSAAVGRAEQKTGTDVSISGTVSDGADVDIVLTHYCYFPMIHTNDPRLVVKGHDTDGASADAPRFGFQNTDGGASHTYDVDYRYVAA